MADFISTGTITATAASTAITGSGTAFVTDGLKAGDLLWIVDSASTVAHPIASVESATALTLAAAYRGTTAAGKSYVGSRRFDEEAAADTYRLLNEYITALNNGDYVATSTNAATGKTTPVDADLLPLADSAAAFVLKKLTFANLWVWAQAKIAAASSKATPVAADSVYLVDSAASNVAKLLTWANLKKNALAWTYPTGVATTSGTEFDFTGIPSGVEEIEIFLSGISLSGTDDILVQIGDSGGIEATGYNSGSSYYGSFVAASAGFIVSAGGASIATAGVMRLSRVFSDGTFWAATHGVANGTDGGGGGGIKSLTTELDRIRLTRSGSNTFDAGAVYVRYR